MNKISRELRLIAREVKIAGLFDVQKKEQNFSNNPTNVSKVVSIYSGQEDWDKMNKLIKPIIPKFDIELSTQLIENIDRIIVYENGDLYLDGMKKWLIYNGKINNETKKILQELLEDARRYNRYLEDTQAYEQNALDILTQSYELQNPNVDFKTWLKQIDQSEYLSAQKLIEQYQKENTNISFESWLDKKFGLRPYQLYVEDSKKLLQKLFSQKKYWIMLDLYNQLNLDVKKLLKILINKSNVTRQDFQLALHFLDVDHSLLDIESYKLILDNYKTSKVAYYLMSRRGKEIIKVVMENDPKYLLSGTDRIMSQWLADLILKNVDMFNKDTEIQDWVLKATLFKKEFKKHSEQVMKILSNQKLLNVLKYAIESNNKSFEMARIIEEKLEQQFGVKDNRGIVKHLILNREPQRPQERQELLNKLPRKIVNLLKEWYR